MDPKEQRKHPRAVVSIPGKFNVLIPENTFQPKEFECHVEDMSERGAMLTVLLDPETYSSMLQKTRYCRLTFDHPELPTRVTGRAVWLQPHGRDKERVYKIGLFFEDCPTDIVVALRGFVNKAKEESKS
jgi:hypothetical protein